MNSFPLRSADDVVTEGMLGASALWISLAMHGVFVGLVIAIPLFVPMCAFDVPEPPKLARVEMVVVEVTPPKIEEPVPRKVEAPAAPKKVSRRRAKKQRALAKKIAANSGLIAILGTTSDSGLASVFSSGEISGGALGGLIGDEVGVASGFGGLGVRGGGGASVGVGGLDLVKASTLKTVVLKVEGVDRGLVRRRLRSRRSEVRRCLSRAESATVTLEGGRARTSDACVARALRGLELPDGASVEVRFSR